MKIKGQKISIMQGDSFTIPFMLVSGEGEGITSLDPTDTIVWVLQERGCGCDIIKKEVTGIDGATFSIHVDSEESAQILPGKYEYGVYMVNGTNRKTLLQPTEFFVERGL